MKGKTRVVLVQLCTTLYNFDANESHKIAQKSTIGDFEKAIF